MMQLRWFLFSVLLAATIWAAPAVAEDGDMIHIGHSIHVPADAAVQDAVCIFCSIHVDGRVTGDVVTIFGNVRLNGDAQHDVVTIFGSLHAAKGSSIEDDVVNIFGSVHLGPGVHVGHDLVALFGGLDIANTATIVGDTVAKPAWIALTPLFILLLVIVVVVREYRVQRRRRALRGYPPTHLP